MSPGRGNEARQGDAAAGYSLYKGGCDDLDEINRVLRQIGHGPIARRSLVHYAALAKRGIEDYVPINKIDHDAKAGRVPTLDDRSRLAAEGFGLYRRGLVGDLGRWLASGRIHQRTIDHYGRLVRDEYESYISINEHDQQHKEGRTPRQLREKDQGQLGFG